MKVLVNIVLLLTAVKVFVHSCPYLFGEEQKGQRNLQRRGDDDGNGRNRGNRDDDDGSNRENRGGGNGGGDQGTNQGDGQNDRGDGGGNGRRRRDRGGGGGGKRSRVPSAPPVALPPVPDICIQQTVDRASVCSAVEEVRALFDSSVLAEATPSVIFASAVRVVFHDAGEVDMQLPSDLLGPDGCLSTDFNNEGLLIPASAVQRVFEPIYRQVCDRISRADFWVLLGKLTLERVITPALPIPYHFGRMDNLLCENGNGRLPSAEGDLDEITRVFVTQMGLTIEDAVTLLGAHSLGRTRIATSGYGFPPQAGVTEEALNAWDESPAVLDNNYYVQMLDRGWRSQSSQSGDLTQWRAGNRPQIMLNVDMALGFPIDVDVLPPGPGVTAQVCRPTGGPGGPPQCVNPTNNTAPNTFALARQFADNNRLFQTEFVRAFTEMACIGYGGVPGTADGSRATGKLGTLTTIDLDTC